MSVISLTLSNYIMIAEKLGLWVFNESRYNAKKRRLTIEKGFEWGGSWTDRKDYQHFEIPTDKIAEWYPEIPLHYR